LHLGQYNCVASNSLNASGPVFFSIRGAAGRLVSVILIICNTLYFKEIMMIVRPDLMPSKKNFLQVHQIYPTFYRLHFNSEHRILFSVRDFVNKLPKIRNIYIK
jgi:hypothetical protein